MSKKAIYLLVGTFLSWSVGYFGADRFYKGEVALGLLKLITFGGFFIWWIIDAFLWTTKLGKELR